MRNKQNQGNQPKKQRLSIGRTSKGTAHFFGEHSKATLSVVLLASLAINGWQFLKYKKPALLPPYLTLNINTDQSMSQVEQYLDSISTNYIADEQSLAKQNNIPSWGCGPSSYSLAVILDKKFFNDKLPINASYDSSEPYEIVERFSLHKEGDEIADHNWLEIFYKDKFLYVDPTFGQFGYADKVAYQEFDVNDPNISAELQKDYGILDLRLSLLINKAINRVPTADNPYPGEAIDPSMIGYYTDIYDDRNDVQNHKIPDDWTSWVSFLTSKYK